MGLAFLVSIVSLNNKKNMVIILKPTLQASNRFDKRHENLKTYKNQSLNKTKLESKYASVLCNTCFCYNCHTLFILRL